MKTYWPYIPMLLVVAIGFFVNMGLSARHGVLGYATGMSVSGLLDETNNQRSQNGRTALALNNLLSQAAQQKANDMAARDYWSHTSPEGTQPWEIISAVGYNYAVMGENLAYGFDTNDSTVAAWMNSAEHRQNVLDSDFTDVGFGIANSPNYQGGGPETIVVAEYAVPKAVPAPAPRQNTPVAAQQPAAARPAPAPVATAPAPTPAVTPVPVTSAPAASTPTSAATQRPAQTAQTPATQQLGSQEVARVDVLTQGNGEWLVIAAAVIISVGALSFVYRHLRMWRRYLVRGEEFVIHHPLLDTIIVAGVVVGFILTQTAGFIH